MEESRLARRKIAEQLAEAVMNRHWTGVHAIGLYGSLAHGDDDDYSDLNISLVTKEAGTVPIRSIARRVDGMIVSLNVRSVGEWLDLARSLTPEWPLTANQFLIAKPLYDPHGWYAVLRETHLNRIRQATDEEFAVLARAALISAFVFAHRARREAARGATDTMRYLLVQTAARAALVSGLLDRTRFRDRREALARTGLERASLEALEERLRELEVRLRERGLSLNATLGELLGPVPPGETEAPANRPPPTGSVGPRRPRPVRPRSPR